MHSGAVLVNLDRVLFYFVAKNTSWKQKGYDNVYPAERGGCMDPPPDLLLKNCGGIG